MCLKLNLYVSQILSNDIIRNEMMFKLISYVYYWIITVGFGTKENEILKTVEKQIINCLFWNGGVGKGVSQIYVSLPLPYKIKL